MIIWKRVKVCPGVMEYHAFFNGDKEVPIKKLTEVHLSNEAAIEISFILLLVSVFLGMIFTGFMA